MLAKIAFLPFIALGYVLKTAVDTVLRVVIVAAIVFGGFAFVYWLGGANG